VAEQEQLQQLLLRSDLRGVGLATKCSTCVHICVCFRVCIDQGARRNASGPACYYSTDYRKISKTQFQPTISAGIPRSSQCHLLQFSVAISWLTGLSHISTPWLFGWCPLSTTSRDARFPLLSQASAISWRHMHMVPSPPSAFRMLPLSVD
jgi:hypothetical protein